MGMVYNAFNISFQINNKEYNGSVEPSDELNDAGAPVLFDVVLNDTSFGHLSFNNCKWTLDEEQPSDLVKAVGKEIEKHFKL